MPFSGRTALDENCSVHHDSAYPQQRFELVQGPRLEAIFSPSPLSSLRTKDWLADMDRYFGTRYPSKAQSARLVDSAALLAIALIAFSVLAEWREGPFFAIWGCGWITVWWALLPDDSPAGRSRRY